MYPKTFSEGISGGISKLIKGEHFERKPRRFFEWILMIKPGQISGEVVEKIFIGIHGKTSEVVLKDILKNKLEKNSERFSAEFSK